MTPLSVNNGTGEVLEGGASCSTISTSLREVELGTNYSIEAIQDEQQLLNIQSDINALGPPSINCINSPNFHNGTKVNIEGINHITLNNHITQQIEKDGQIVDSPGTKVPEKFSKRVKYFMKDRPTQFWIAGLLLAVLSITVLTLFFCLYKIDVLQPESPTPGHDDNLGDGIQVIHRKDWLARPPLNQTKVGHPLKMVRILHTGGTNCTEYQNCASKVLALQGWQVATQHMPDIAFNYLIGGDGNVYVGRGAGIINQWQKDGIDIVYIGNFLAPYDKMTDKMNEAGKRLITRLSNQGFLTPDYIVIGQNQTYKKTQSPGENIYKMMRKWPHFDAGIYY